jgi:hypothetical protein
LSINLVVSVTVIDITRRILTFFFARSPEAPSTGEEGTAVRCIRHTGSESRDTPTIIVLSLSSSWDVSMEGMVPDIERSRGIVDEERDGGMGKSKTQL